MHGLAGQPQLGRRSGNVGELDERRVLLCECRRTAEVVHHQQRGGFQHIPVDCFIAAFSQTPPHHSDCVIRFEALPSPEQTGESLHRITHHHHAPRWQRRSDRVVEQPVSVASGRLRAWQSLRIELPGGHEPQRGCHAASHERERLAVRQRVPNFPIHNTDSPRCHPTLARQQFENTACHTGQLNTRIFQPGLS